MLDLNMSNVNAEKALLLMEETLVLSNVNDDMAEATAFSDKLCKVLL